MNHNEQAANRPQQKQRMSLKYKVFLYFVIFTAIMLGLLWLTQTVFLDNFYHYIKVQEVRNASVSIARNVGTNNLTETIDSLCTANQMCIEVANSRFQTVSSGSHDICYSFGTMADCCVHNSRAFKHKYATMTQAKEFGKAIFLENALETGVPNDSPFAQGKSAPGAFTVMSKDSGSLLEYVEYVSGADKNNYYIVINSKITPVNATAKTLRFQLILASFVFLMVAIVLALILARHIAKPITKITKSARKLATGDYQADFSGGGYREIVMLGDSLHHAAGELSKVDHLKNELIANISHDLRTPLTMISGYAEVMRDIPGENSPENVQIIIDEANRLTTLVNAVLDLSKIQSGAVKYQPEEINLTQAVKTIIGRYTKLTEVDGYQIRFDFSEELCVLGDSAKLSQVLYNLINNAVSYTGEDKRILIRQSRCGAQNDWVRLEIIDTGCGISKENLENIWDRYFKETKTHKRAVVGTGLGLSIVKGILEMHNARYGVISDESPMHHGSDFWFELPILQKHQTNTAEEDTEKSSSQE